MPKIVCLSDTHEFTTEIKVPAGDILVHAGDFTFMGDPKKVKEFNDWLGTLPHKHKLVCAGNHDVSFEEEPKEVEHLITNATYLKDASVNIEGLNFYLSPWQPSFGHGWAFNLDRGRAIRYKWEQIPVNTDVLVTHGPPMGILDEVERYNTKTSEYELDHVGCWDLMDIINTKLKLKAHVFGHLHLNGGNKMEKNGTIFVNAAVCDERYKPNNPIIVFDL